MAATVTTTSTVVAAPESVKEQLKVAIDLPSPRTKQGSPVQIQQPDSGYSSPEKNGDTTKQEPDTGPRPYISFPFAKDTFRFIKDIDESSIARYKEISPELEKLLKSKFEASGIFSRRRRLRSISTRLVVIGKTEADAKECVAVFCDQPTSKGVAQYLKRDEIIQQLLNPSDPATPSFEIVVKEHPPRLRSTSPNVHVHCDSTDLEETSFCGLSISFTDCDGVIRCGTFGGVVKVTPTEGDAFILGMTTAHTLVEWEDSDTDLDEHLELHSMHLSEEHTERPGSASSPTASLAPQKALVGANCRGFREPFELGKITASSADDADACDNPYMDWALFDLNEIRPNHLPNSMRSKPIIGASPIASSGRDEFRVLVIGNSRDLKVGRISKVPSRIMIGAGSSFTDALLLTLDSGTVCDGESGAWVVDSTTFEVVGHVVATDVLGDVYVIPIQNTLADMQRILGAKSVEIPTAFDISLVRLQKMVSTMYPEEHSSDDYPATLSNIATETKQEASLWNRADSEISGDDENVQDRGRDKMQKTAPTPELRLACPFFKHDPSKCPNLACSGPGWPTTQLMKQHMYHIHRSTVKRCYRCLKVFRHEDHLVKHQMAEVLCVAAQVDRFEEICLDEIDPFQHFQLRKLSDKTKDETERWKEIYLIIFPDATEIPSPFCDEDSNPAFKISYDDMKTFKREIVAGICDDLESRFEQFADEARESVTKIVQDTFKRIIDQRIDREKSLEASVIPLEAQEACVEPKVPDTGGMSEMPETLELSDILAMHQRPKRIVDSAYASRRPTGGSEYA